MLLTPTAPVRTSSPRRSHTADRDVLGRSTRGDDHLRGLLAVAAELDASDHAAWRAFRASARSTVAAMIERGTLPGHLAIAAHEPPAVVTRSLAAAWRHARTS